MQQLNTHGRAQQVLLNLVFMVMILKSLIGIGKVLKVERPAWKRRLWIGLMMLLTPCMIWKTH